MEKEIKVTFRPATELDADIILSWWNNGEIMSSVGYPNGLNITKKNVIESIRSYQVDAYSNFLLVLDESDFVIGEFCYKIIRKKIATFDVKIGQLEKQGQGYGYQTVLRGIEYIKQELSIDKIELSVAPENYRAVALYRSLGFKKVNTLKNHWKDGLGNNRDTIVYQLDVRERNAQ
ncbi:GNAT family N-acetyltransferase [Vagococcus sp. JNUCC 83]